MSAEDALPESVEELLAHALALETEAAEGYAELAEQMALHNNPEAAQMFRKMAAVESEHLAHMAELTKGRALPHIAPWDFKWQAPDSPEAVQPVMGGVHYLMKPYQAIELALKHERRAAAFYARIAELATSTEVRELAARLAREEQDHADHLAVWQTRFPKPEAGWREDPDPPNEPG